MRRKQRMPAHRICVIAGTCLLVAAVALWIGWQWGIRASQQQMENYVHTLHALLPEIQGAAPEERSDNTMPVLSLNEIDFIGILEMPSYESVLPVCADWGQVSRYPCCLSGNVYDGSMQIGATSQKGQYDFYREISVGDSLFFTDMTGNRYSYTVTDLRYEKHADQDVLQCQEAALTLFVKNMYGLEYLVIFCNALY